MKIVHEVGGCGPVGSTAATLVNEIMSAVLGGGNFGQVKLTIDGPVAPDDDTWSIKFTREDGTVVSRRIHGRELHTAHPNVQQALREIRQELEAGAK